MPTAVCAVCRRERPHEDFPRDRTRKNGRMCRCRDCDNARRKRHYETVGKARYQARYQPTRSTKDCADCGATIPARTRSRRCADCYPAYRKRKQAYDPAKERARRDKRGRAKNRIYSDVTADHIRELYRKTKRCPICNVRLTATPTLPHSREVDHIVPLGTGGTHTIGNLRVICRLCNLRRPKDGSDVTGQVTLWACDLKAAKAIAASAMSLRGDAVPSKTAQRRAIARQAGEARRLERRQRATKALDMRKSGMKWQDITDALGYANTSGPYLAIKQTLGIDPTTIGTDHRKV